MVAPPFMSGHQTVSWSVPSSGGRYLATTIYQRVVPCAQDTRQARNFLAIHLRQAVGDRLQGVLSGSSATPTSNRLTIPTLELRNTTYRCRRDLALHR